jgi:glycosyltransferase involved in cell wall biosynthesis
MMTRKKLYFKPPNGMARAKKILFIVTKSNLGGAQRYVYDLATRLPRDTYEVAVACGPDREGNTGRLSHLLNAKQIPTIEVPSLTRDVRMFDDIRAFFALAGLLREEKPDVVHLNSSKAGGLGALAARLAGVPRIVFTIHGLPADEERSWWQRALIALATWFTAVLSHRIITLSDNAFTRVRRLPFLYRTTVLIHNGIEAPAFLSPHEARDELRAIDPSVPEGFLVGSIGELHANKGYDLAIDAIAIGDRHLVVIGDGEEKGRLLARARERGVSDRVHFLGFVPDAARYVRAFDVFLLPSRKEGLPYVLLEAGAAHVPILASDIPGVRDIVLPNFTGLLIPREARAVAAALRRLEDDSLARSLTEEMATRIRTTFSMKTMLEKTLATYDA